MTVIDKELVESFSLEIIANSKKWGSVAGFKAAEAFVLLRSIRY